MGKIAPSILSADFARLREEIQEVERAGADYIHVDVMDGHFVPNITVGPLMVEAVRRCTDLPLDVHLMITDPDLYIERFAQAGATLVTVHLEAVIHLHRTVDRIKELGLRPGVALNPATPLQGLDHILEELDMVLLMTVNPGFERQSFIPAVIPKIQRLRETLAIRGLRVDIEVDGGIGPKSIALVSRAGANVFVAGSAIFHSRDYAETIRLMKEEMS